jgi:hypothetical protein
MKFRRPRFQERALIIARFRRQYNTLQGVREMERMLEFSRSMAGAKPGEIAFIPTEPRTVTGMEMMLRQESWKTRLRNYREMRSREDAS